MSTIMRTIAAIIISAVSLFISAVSLFEIHAVGASVYDFGARGDGREVDDAAIRRGSATITSARAGFTKADIGKAVICAGCGARGNLVTTIAEVSWDGRSVRLAEAAAQDREHAAFYWGTPDDSAFARMYAAACASQDKDMYVPPARGSFYLLLRTWELEDCSGWTVHGSGARSWLLGDPGNRELILLTGSATIDGLQFTNIHGLPDLYWFGVHLENADGARVLNSLFTGARCAIEIDGGGRRIEIAGNRFVGVTTSGVNANGGRNSLVLGVTVRNNLFRDTVWTDEGGTGHDVNLEDTADARVADNSFEDLSTRIEGSSAIQVSTEAFQGSLSRVEISGNTAAVSNPSADTANFCIDASSEPGNRTRDYVAENNECRGYKRAFEWSGIDAPDQIDGVVIRGNRFLNSGDIFFTGTALAHEGVTIESNRVEGGSVAVNRIDGVIVRGNAVSGGVRLAGVRDSVIENNRARSALPVSCETYGVPCANNKINTNTPE